MQTKQWLAFISFITLLTFIPTQSYANTEWRLNNNKSTFNFISVKKSTVAETHQFKKFAGTIKSSGETYVSIDLSSVDTNIDIRDERMQKYLFETDKFSNAEVTAQVNASSLGQLKIGEVLKQKVNLTLSLHGQSEIIPAELNVIKLSKDKILVTPVTPIMINANQFDLTAGILKLQEIAGLPSISASIPVSFQLVFEK